MKYKYFYTPVIIIISILKFIIANDQKNQNKGIFYDKFNHDSEVEKIIPMWNKSSFVSENVTYHSSQPFEKILIFEKDSQNENNREFSKSEAYTQNFPTELRKCIIKHQFEITENYVQGKNIILNCFKAILILKLARYIEASPKSRIKLFNGFLELQKLSSGSCSEDEKNSGSIKLCRTNYNKDFGQITIRNTTYQNKKNVYMKMYKKAIQKLVNKKNKFHSYKNLTEEERLNQLNKINEGSNAFLSEILRSLLNEKAEKVEEEKLKKEIFDSKLLSILDDFSKNYMLKLKFYPGVSARMLRSNNGGVTFDLEINEAFEEEDGDSSSYEGSTREIKDLKPQAKDYFDDSEESSGGNRKKSKKGNKKRKKQAKKKAKALKKIIPYLLLPMIIQMTLLPLVFKKLFFLAMKALFAGKMALILIGFNLLRNTCIKDENKYSQRIRVEHYGYNQGEEYGAWVNGRSLKEPSVMSALSEMPYQGQKPIY